MASQFGVSTRSRRRAFGDGGRDVDVEALVLVGLRFSDDCGGYAGSVETLMTPSSQIFASRSPALASAVAHAPVAARSGVAGVTRRFVVPSTRGSGQGGNRQQRDERTKLELPHPASSQGGTRAFPVRRPDYRPRGWCGQRDFVHNPPVGLRESAPFRLQGTPGEGIQRVPEGLKTKTCGSTSSPPLIESDRSPGAVVGVQTADVVPHLLPVANAVLEGFRGGPGVPGLSGVDAGRKAGGGLVGVDEPSRGVAVGQVHVPAWAGELVDQRRPAQYGIGMTVFMASGARSSVGFPTRACPGEGNR